MKVPKEYVDIKRLFNLSLFGIEDAEKIFATHKKLAFSKAFIAYQDDFLTDEASDWNTILTQYCKVCLSKLNKVERRSLVKVILDNQQLCEALIFMLMLNEKTLDSDQATTTFMMSLSSYMEYNKIDEIIILFIQQHFLGFERIDPSKYENFELDETQYWEIIGDYLSVQKNIF